MIILEELANAVFIINLFSTVAMTGAIWLAQLSLYPLMEFVGSHSYTNYEREHVRRISFVAWFLLSLELLTSVALVVWRPYFLSIEYAWAGVIFVVVIWLNTWFIQYPIHKKLTQGYDEALHSKLVSTNWVRTFAWSARTVLMVIIISNIIFRV